MNNIDDLLNNYFEGVASPEEEQALKSYFRSNDVMPQHSVYKPLFEAFDAEKQTTAPPFGIPAVTKHKNTVQKLWIAAASAAAVILLAVVLFPFTRQSDYLVYINGKEVTDPQKAQQYADKMFRQAEALIRASYKPFEEANTMQTTMDADKIFDDLSKKINYIESKH